MKKLSAVLVIALVVGAGIAYASTLAVPWFADSAPANTGSPPAGGQVALIYLKSNVEDELICEITYFNGAGDALGPYYPDNTFSIAPLSALAFRPVALDPDFETTIEVDGVEVGPFAGGYEGAQGVAVPDRPRDVDTRKNGSAVISWTGGPSDVQGYAATIHNTRFAFGYLLPPGV